MDIFTSIDLQKQTGDVQRAAAQRGVVITAHGKPRNVMLSVEEFCRLKKAAGEQVPQALAQPRATTVRHDKDPLGYDGSNFPSAARQMAEDAIAGRNADAVAIELGVLRGKFPGLRR